MNSATRPPAGAFSFSPVDVRLIALASLACAEFALATVMSTTPSIEDSPGAITRIVGSANSWPPIALAGVGALVLVLNRRLIDVAGELRREARGYRWWPWLVAQLSAYGALLIVSAPVFGPDATATIPSAAWLIEWILVAALTVGCFLLAVGPACFWSAIVRRERAAILASCAVALAAWLSGLLVQRFWPPLAAMTLDATHMVLSLFYTDIYREPGTAILGVGDFAAEIGRPCSGYEGMALITVFLGVYLWLFRRELRFPQAFLLLPAGIVLIWIANVLRIAALIAIGASISPAIAADGFHSQAGWIMFTVVSLTMIWTTHRLLISPREVAAASASRGVPAAALSLLLPLIVQLAASMLIAAFSSRLAVLYPLGVVATGATIWRLRANLRPLVAGATWHSVAIGIAVFGFWLLLQPPDVDESGVVVAQRLADMPSWLASVWVAFRIFGAVVTVPIAEELAFRGYLLRKLVASDFESVPPGTFTWLSLVVSSLLFGLLHGAWIAGTLAGAGFALALYRRGQLGDAIVAHAAANALIAVAVLGFGQWSLWA